MRNATAFGFSPRLRADIVLNNLVGHALLSNTIRVLSDGTPWRPLVHADDIAGAVVAALAAPADGGARAGVQRRHREATTAPSPRSPRRWSDAVPGAELLITGETGNDPRSYRVDFSRARKELGYEAQWTIPDGAAQLAREYRARGLTQEAFDKRFTRLAVLSAPPAGGRARREHARRRLSTSCRERVTGGLETAAGDPFERYRGRMCRNIRPLHNFAPPATDAEVHEAALQYVRKISGSAKPSQANAHAFDRAVAAVERGHPPAARRAGDHRAAEGPRGGGGEGPASGAAVRYAR